MAVSQLDATRTYQPAQVSGVQLILSSSPDEISLPEAVQQQFREVTSLIQAQTRMRELVRLYVTDRRSGSSDGNSGEIGLRIHTLSADGSEAATVDLVFHGDTGLSREVVTALPVGEMRQRLVRLLRVYMVEGCGKDTFTSWSRGLSDQQLRSQMGITEQAGVAASETQSKG